MRDPALWLPREPLLLASTSPTRRGLLEAVGIPVEASAPGVDERAAEAGAAARDGEAVALHLARAKALAVSAARPGRLVVGADQTLACGGELFHKPASRAAAAAQLARLAGRTHTLACGVCLARDGAVLAEVSERAHLAMRPLDAAAIDRYLAAAGDEVLGGVGVYRIEGVGLHLFERVEGDHSTILGLPLLPLLAALRGLGVLAL